MIPERVSGYSSDKFYKLVALFAYSARWIAVPIAKRYGNYAKVVQLSLPVLIIGGKYSSGYIFITVIFPEKSPWEVRTIHCKNIWY